MRRVMFSMHLKTKKTTERKEYLVSYFVLENKEKELTYLLKYLRGIFINQYIQIPTCVKKTCSLSKIVFTVFLINNCFFTR